MPFKHRNTFIHAAGGIGHALKTEINFRIHVVVMALVISMGMVLQISAVEWLFVAGCCMLVLCLELVNTAVENLCDFISPGYHPLIGVVKDVAAGAVLVGAAGSCIAGTIIFLPKIIHCIKALI